MVALVEEYEAEEEDVEEAIESDHEDKDELTMPRPWDFLSCSKES